LRIELTGCSEVIRHVLDGMEQEIEVLRRALASSAEAADPAAEQALAAQPTA